MALMTTCTNVFAAAKAGLSKAITIAIFIVAGLQLRRGEALAALKAPSAVLFGGCTPVRLLMSLPSCFLPLHAPLHGTAVT